MILKYLLPILISLLVVMSCKEQKKVVVEAQPEKLNLKHLGQFWELQRGFRGGKISAALEDTYFDFTNPGTVKTNLIEESTFDLYLDDQSHFDHQFSDGSQITFKIEELADTFLLIRFKYMDFDFRLDLQPGIPVEHPEL